MKTNITNNINKEQETEEQLLAYINLVNRIGVRIAQEQNNTDTFDSLSLDGIP